MAMGRLVNCIWAGHPSSDPALPGHLLPQGEKGRRTQALHQEPPSPLEGEGPGVRGVLLLSGAFFGEFTHGNG